MLRLDDALANMRHQGYSGSNYDRYVERNEQSTLHQMKKTYYTTKQAVYKKLGKKEDAHVVASDSELDSKIEVFKAIQRSCMDLLRNIEKYQDRLCALSQEENAMGRFLKTQSQLDKTRAGKMMAAVGKSQSFSSQQRLALRVPLVRLYQEVETFRYRAISDTLMTINRMEAARTEYRGALLWMKDVSEELDPDTYKQLEKFRKVQAQVKKTKAKFDKLKLDSMQKIDLLAASRCNMFSHVLANYQTTLLHFWDKTSRTMAAVSESFKGYQHYEFNMLKELAEPSRKLAEETSNHEAPERDTDRKKDGLISFGEEEGARKDGMDADRDSLENFFDDDEYHDEVPAKPAGKGTGDSTDSKYSDFQSKDGKMEGFNFTGKIDKKERKAREKMEKLQGKDLLSDDLEPDDADKDDMTLLNEILNAPSTGGDDFTKEWQAVFGDTPLSTTGNYTPVESDQPPELNEYMPSALLDMTAGVGQMNLGQAQMPQDITNFDNLEFDSFVSGKDSTNDIGGAASVAHPGIFGTVPSQKPAGASQSVRPPSTSTGAHPPRRAPPPPTGMMPGQPMPAMGQMLPPGGAQQQQATQPTAGQAQGPRPKAKKEADWKEKLREKQMQAPPGQQKDMSAWFNLFADLDPLANPDAVGKTEAELAADAL
ncbi:islet cell autoantigen 1-like isoform X8 [Lineus longissimus]|uniref:islet cell autoantigen 1-like isoform X8 n=1 Tax=Lineus longissimus TaxID=88925 RepID=UPI00315D8238